MVAFDQPTTDAKLLADAERNHTAWSDALAALNVEAVTALAEDAAIENALIRHLLGSDEGMCRGRKAIGEFMPLPRFGRCPIGKARKPAATAWRA
jgi:hypothetical protein